MAKDRKKNLRISFAMEYKDVKEQFTTQEQKSFHFIFSLYNKHIKQISIKKKYNKTSKKKKTKTILIMKTIQLCALTQHNRAAKST